MGRHFPPALQPANILPLQQVISLSREPHYEKGQLVWQQENQEILHILERYRNQDHDSFQYKVADPTHTAYEWFNQQDLRSVSVDLPICVLMNMKPSTLFDLDELVETTQNLTRFSEIKLEQGGE